MASIPATPTKRKRRWLTFSLRTLLVFTLLVGLVLGYFGSIYHRVQNQRALIEKMSALGFRVKYNYDPEFIDIMHPERSEPPGPWIGRALIGEDAYAHVDSVSCGDRAAHKPEDLRALSLFPKLRKVSIHGDWVDDGAIDHLLNIPSLEHVDLAITRITSKGYSRLARCPTLKSLRLTGPEAGDDTFAPLHEASQLERLDLQRFDLSPVSFAHIGRIKSLRELHLFNVKGIDREAFKQIAGLSKLESLAISGANIDEEGFSHLSRLREIKTLRFSKCSFSEEALDEIGSLNTLEDLSLQEMPVGDACLDTILEQRNLHFVNLSNTNVTDDGLLRLAELPNLRQVTVKGLVSAAAGQELASRRPECGVSVKGSSGRFEYKVKDSYVPWGNRD